MTGPILMTGGTGQVGSALLPMLRALGQVVAPTRAEMDLGDAASVRAAVRAIKPRWIVNPGAYTAVDRAESERAAAWAVNAEAPRVLGEEARALGAPVIHVSTDYVFSGEGAAAWREDDATGPLNEYGRSKLAGEEALDASGAGHLTLRTSWVYAASGQNFLRTMLRLGRERDELRVVDDQYGTPTAAGDLAELIVWLMRRFEMRAADEDLAGGVGRGADADPNATGEGLAPPRREALLAAVHEEGGTVHAGGGGEPTTWFGFAGAIFAELGAAQPGARVPRLVPIASAEFPTPARRPGNSRLSGTLLENRFGYKMPAWRESLRRVMREVAASEAAAGSATR